MLENVDIVDLSIAAVGVAMLPLLPDLLANLMVVFLPDAWATARVRAFSASVRRVTNTVVRCVRARGRRAGGLAGAGHTDVTAGPAPCLSAAASLWSARSASPCLRSTSSCPCSSSRACERSRAGGGSKWDRCVCARALRAVCVSARL